MKDDYEANQARFDAIVNIAKQLCEQLTGDLQIEVVARAMREGIDLAIK